MYEYSGLASYSLLLLLTTFVLVGSFSCRPRLNNTKYCPNVTGSGILNFVVFVPLPDEDYDPAFDQGYSIIPAVELAVDQINRRTDILPCNHLILNVKDSGCDKASKTAVETVSVLRDLLFTLHGPIGIIGPACSEDSIFVAKTFRKYNLPVFYSGTTPHLSEHAEETPNAYGMISSADILTDTLMRIADKENWNWPNIAVLYDESEEHFRLTYDAFVRGLNSSQQVGYTRPIADSQIPLGEIVSRSIRIVIVFSGKKPARQLACLAGQSTVNFIFPIRQLIFTERTLEDFLGDENAEPLFTEHMDDKKYYCDNETVMRGLNGSILLNQALDSVEPDVLTVSNYTAKQVKEDYRERLSECGKVVNPSRTLMESSFAYSYYDAVWALAYGLDIGIPKRSFQAVHDAIRNNVSFQGVSGWIDFKDNLHVSSHVNLTQMNGSVTVLIGTKNNQSELMYDANSFISDNLTTVKNVLHPALTVLGFLTCSLSFLMTLLLQLMNTYFHQYPSVKASSPRLNHFIFTGCYLLVFAVFISTLRHVVPDLTGVVLCNLDIVCIILGYCLIFATIFAKSWRTYRIFSHPFQTQRFIGDSSLSVLTVIFLIVQILLTIPFLAVGPYDKFVSSSIDTSLWLPLKRLTTTCVSESIAYITIPLIFQLLLTIATVFLATLNRKIKHANFRTTKQIIKLAYILAIVWHLGGSLLVILDMLGYSEDILYLIFVSLLAVTEFLSQLILIAPALALAIDAKWNVSQTAKLRKESWLKKSFSRSSKTESVYMY